MNNLRRYFRQLPGRLAVAALLCVLLAAGCAPAEGPETPDAAAFCRASLLISVGNPSTRAPQEGDYEAGTIAENHIDIQGGDFRIMLFDADNTLLCSLTDIVISPLSEGEKTYEASGLLDAEAVAQARTAVKAVMLANWKGAYPDVTPGVTTIASLAAASSAAFDFEADGVPGVRTIPMFGVSNLLEGLPFAEGESTQLGTLHLLRAYAKLRVRCAPESLPIESVSITRANDAAMLIPADVSCQNDYVTGTYVTDYTRRPTLPADVSTLADVPLVLSGEDEWTLYVPEYRNTVSGTGSSELSDAARTRLAVSFTGGGTDYVEFRYYSAPPAWSGAREGDYFDILRNNIYDYTLSKTAGETDISVIVDVQPYASVAVRPELGLDRDEEGYIILERYEDGTYKILTEAGEIIRDKDGDRLLRYFSDGSLLCEEIIYRDYIHDDSETDYSYTFEKDASGGNMVILRETSDCSACTGAAPGDEHDHGAKDRPLFVADKNSVFYRVVYPDAEDDADEKKATPTLSRLDVHGDTLIQANGYQLRDIPDLSRYIGTYVVKVADKTEESGFREELRRFSDGTTLDWNTLLPVTRSLRPATPGRTLQRLRRANAEAMRKYGRLLNP